jgi:hypothetical protein
MAKEAAILIADLHVNSTLGLCKPGIHHDDGGIYHLNKVQQWLWQTWEECLDDIADLTTGYYKNLILPGDLIELDTKARSWQVISANPVVTIGHAIDILEPVVDSADETFVVRGTEAHTGKSAWGEEQIARDFDTRPDPETGSHSWWHLRAEFGGVKFDVAHHANMGNLPWTYANAGNKLAITTMYEYMEWGETPPDIVARAHQHRFVDSGRTYDTRGIYLPAWQFKTAFLHRIGKANARPSIGALVFLCDDGEYTWHDLRYKPQRSKAWRSMQESLPNMN